MGEVLQDMNFKIVEHWEHVYVTLCGSWKMGVLDIYVCENPAWSSNRKKRYPYPYPLIIGTVVHKTEIQKE